MEIALGIITGIVCIVELIYCFLEKEKLRKIIKPFCLVFLMLFLLSLKLTNVYVYAALIFGLIGDIFLIFKKKHRMLFLLGAFAFLIGHAFYIFTFANLLSFPIPEYVIVGLVIVGFFTPLIPYKLCYRHTKSLTIPLAIYGYILVLECALAIVLAVDSGSIFALLIGIGNFLFIVSDTLIFVSLFIKDFKRRDFYIMLTYLLAQALMSIGLNLLLR